MSEVKSDYFRADIQGLRGIAVLLVVIYHSGIGLPGGFAGVDVFFVISGFVISQLLLRELELTGRINFKNFYTRRVRRLLPALALVSIVTLGVSIFVLSPFGAQQDVIATAQTTSIFGANIYLLLQQTYANLGANPLRHTWSLAVEEQFYLLFPVVVFLVWKVTARKSWNARVVFAIIMTFVGLFSFVVSLGLSMGRASQLIARIAETTPYRVAFFSMPTRAWEFVLGGLAFVVYQRFKNLDFKSLSLISFVGVLGLLWSANSIHADGIYPGWVALIPTLSTVALLLAGPTSYVNRSLLSNRFMSFLGDVSYGFYLWHWPCVVFATVLWPSSEYAKPLAIVFSVVPTLIMYRWFESPIRVNPKIRGSKALALSLSCILVPLSVSGLSEKTSRQLQKYFKTIDVGWSERRLAVLKGCYGKIDFEWTEKACRNRLDSSRGLILVLGDSQAASTSDGIQMAGEAMNLDVAYSTWPGCPMFARVPRDGAGCKTVANFNLSLIQDLNPTLVVLSNAGLRYTWDGLEVARDEKSGGGYPQMISEREISVGESYLEMILQIVAQGTRVIVLLEVPHAQFSKQISLLQPDPEIVPTKSAEQHSRVNINELLKLRLADNERVSLVDFDDVICPEGVCLPTLGGKWIFMENSHLNPEGSRMLNSKIQFAISHQLAASNSSN